MKKEEKIVENRSFMPTTFDNEWNPWTNFDEWDAYDRMMGYHTWEKVALLMPDSDQISEIEEESATNFAIEELINLMPAVWTKVYRPSPVKDPS